MSTILDTPAYKKLKATNDFLLSVANGGMATVTTEQHQVMISQMVALTLNISIQLAQLQREAGY